MNINCKYYKDGSTLYQQVEDGLVLDHFESYPIDKNEEIYCEYLRGFVRNGEIDMFPFGCITVSSKRLNIVWDKGKLLTLYDGDIEPKNVIWEQTTRIKNIEILITRC